MNRRGFLGGAVVAATQPPAAAQSGRPNILWITCEDIGPQLACYGDRYSVTPNLDSLAARGLMYTHAWSNAPVCAPARTTIISGMYPPSTGAEHMRSETRLPSGMKMFPQYLREAGYYCTNNAKEDYNLRKPGQVWDESSNKAHWKNRSQGQPFFAVFNNVITHESQIRTRPHKWVHDPAEARVPAYHPDTPEVRQDWAQYYDNITAMDGTSGRLLDELEEAGLAGDTIVFFYGDHGSGMPRSKRWPYNSGLSVPMIVYIPPKYRGLAPPDYTPGGKSERLISFVDLAPTVLSLAGVPAPKHFQGYAFLGKHAAAPQPFVYGFRGRMDERYDMVRSVRDQRYVYLRQYMPHKIYGQHIAYMFETPTTRRWRELYDQGKLSPPQTYFWEPKPSEELYDLNTDRDEVRNLASSRQHRAVLGKMRKAQRDLALRIRDVGFLPEDEIHKRSAQSSPYETGHDAGYPLDRILRMAELASSRDATAMADLLRGFDDPDSAVRYWAAMGIRIRGAETVKAASARLQNLFGDPSPSVRVIAAEAIGVFGNDEEVTKALAALVGLAPIDRHGVYISMLALNAIDAMGKRATSAQAAIRALPKEHAATPRTMTGYVPALIKDILEKLEKA
ncbi:MAG: sulfatase-like hydrolase/transferase [Bryobacteraceae bacterium]